MGKLVGKMGHHCGSRKGLNLYEEDNGNVTGWCFSCKKFEPDPLEGNTMEKAGIQRSTKTPEEIEEEINEILTCPITGLPDRKIGKATMEYFETRVSLDEERREDVVFHYYPYIDIKTKRLSGFKVRRCEDKKIWSLGAVKDVYPFGWSQAIATGSPRVYITEGEIDAMSLFSVLMQKNVGTAYEKNIPAVISVPHGAAAAGKDLAKVISDIRKHFKEVVLVFDMDKAGNAAVEDILRIIPEAKVATLPCKDVNECVLEGHVKALQNAVLFKAETPKNTRLVYAEDLFEAAKEPAKFGLSWPWKNVTEQTRGIRFGETIYVGAAQKMGHFYCY